MGERKKNPPSSPPSHADRCALYCPAELYSSWGESWDSRRIIHLLQPETSQATAVFLLLLFFFEVTVFFCWSDWHVWFSEGLSVRLQACVQEARLQFHQHGKVIPCLCLTQERACFLDSPWPLAFFFSLPGLTFPLEECQSMCNPIPLFTPCWKSYTSARYIRDMAFGNSLIFFSWLFF